MYLIFILHVYKSSYVVKKTIKYDKISKKHKLLTCLWQNHEFTYSQIHEFKVLLKGQSLLKPLFNGVLFLICYFK